MQRSEYNMATTRWTQAQVRSPDGEQGIIGLIRAGTVPGLPAGSGTPLRGLHKKAVHGKKDLSDELKDPFSKSFFPTCSDLRLGTYKVFQPCFLYFQKEAQ